MLGSDDLAKLTHIGSAKAGKGFSSRTISCLYRCSGGGEALEGICAQADAAIDEGVSFLILSDRETNAEMAPIPSLLATTAVHHHLLRRQTRTHVGLIVEAGDVREVHHVATLIGYGASAVTPYLAMEAAEELARAGRLAPTSADEAVAHLIKALGKGMLKVMSKIGISTVSSYCGAQVFQAIGLDEGFVARYFTGTPSPLGCIGIDVIAQEVAERHAIAYPPSGISPAHRALDVGGEYARGVDDQAKRLMTLRGLMRPRTDEVEPVSEIVKRFATGAMSFGSISREAHETMAIAMNTLGARSNSGEGGEAPEPLPSHPSSTRARPGNSASPKPSRPSSWAICATASSSRPTDSSRPDAMSSSPPCSEPRSSVSRPSRSSFPAAS